jgi:hypothetical protein
MRRVLVCSGVLGGGTAIVFALAALTASLFPNGTVLSTPWNGAWLDQRMGWGGMPVPEPVMRELPAVDPRFSVTDEFVPLPGDTAGGDWEWSGEGAPVP